MQERIIRRLVSLAALVSAFAPSAAFGQAPAVNNSIDKRIAKLSGAVSAKLQQKRVPSVGERLGAALDQTRTNLAKVETRLRRGDSSANVAATLREERQKLAVLDEAYQTEFRDVEMKLRRANLPADVLAERLAGWRDFTANYRTRMAATQAGFDQLSGKSSIRDFEIAKLRESLGTAAVPRISGVTDRVPGMTPHRDAVAAAAAIEPPQANGPPTPDDLSANSEVVLTPDIVAQAAALGNAPAALYAWVYNTIQFVPYYLAVQNSETVLWSGKGNDADQATLLIALLRASGIPARFVRGDITVPIADTINWMGVKDAAAAKVLLNFNTNFSTVGSNFSVLHVWVEAWLNTPRGNAWVPMTPSIKHQTFQPGLTFTQPTFNRTQFLSTVQSSLASEVYATQLLNAFQQAYPGQDFSAAPYTGTITPISGATLPAFPYPITQVVQRASSLIPHTISLSVQNQAGTTTYLTESLSMPQVSSQSVTVGFIPATANDQSIVTSFGGLANVPAGMVNLLPEILVNEAVTATGSTPIALGQSISLLVTHTESYATSPNESFSHNETAGNSIAVTVGFNQISEPLVAARIDSMLGEESTATSDAVTRELLSLAGLRYFQRIETEKQRIFTPLQILPVLGFPEECATYASVQVNNLFDRPYLVTPGDLAIDAQSTVARGYDLNAGGAEALSVPGDLSVSRAVEAATSGLENQLWEELVLIPSISTIKALQINNQSNIPTLAINSANVSNVSMVSAPSGLAQTLKADIANGATVTISRQPTVFGVWTGFGWIEDFTDTFSFYIQQTNTPVFDGGTNGGNPPTPDPPTNNPGPTGNPPNSSNNTTSSDPVDISNGNLFQQQMDLTISSRGPATLVQRTYNSLLAANNGPFGYGWTYNYVVALKDNQSSVTYTNESGGVFSFTLLNGAYVSPAGLDLTLTKTAQGYTIRSAHGTVWSFNTTGVLQSITDRNHNATTLAYQGALLTTITDALGRVVTLSYDGNGHLTTIKDFAGRSITYTYSAAGDLASMTDAAGNVTQYLYYTASPFAHLLQTATKPAGNSTSFEYYVNGQTARVSDSAGRSMRFFYLPLAGETLFIDQRGYTSTYYYNSLGNVTRLIKADGNYWDASYTADAKLASFTDEDGYTSTFAYDALGNPTSRTDALGNTTKLTYDPIFSMPTSVTDPLGNVTQLQYDANGDLTGATLPLGIKVQFTYDSFGELLTATDALGNTGSLSYDSSGNLQSTTDALTNTARFQHDSLRRLIGATDALGNQTAFQWDVVDRITNLTSPLRSSWSVSYSPDGDVAQSTDANGNQTVFSRDALDNLGQVKDASGGVTQYGYATPTCACMTDNELTGFIDAAGVSHGNSYDSNQRLTQTVDAIGNTTTFVYDARGDLVAKTDANGHTIHYTYDADQRLTQKTFPDGTTAKFTYDANGNLLSAANANTTVTFTYDALNRATSVLDSRFGQTLTYAYDQDGRRTSLTDPFGVTKYTYDADSRVTSIANPSGGSGQFTYDAASRRTALKYSNGLSTSYQYDAASEPTALATSGAGPRFSYTYDSQGNTTAVTDAAGAHAYRYDSLNRLTAASGTTAESYTYDGAGNRTLSATSGYQYDADGRLTAAEGFSFTSDNNGNLISRRGASGTTLYTYDFENRLIEIQFPDGTSASYLYDALGRRIQKSVNGMVTNYLYDGAYALLELSSSGAMAARYTRGPVVDEMLTMERGGQTYFYHANAIGSVAALTDSSGNAVCGYTYDSFGRTQPCTAVTNPFAYAGREYDAESGLYYMRARYYDPVTGRFASVDPLNLTGRVLQAQYGGSGALLAQRSPQQLNAYSYAINNPLGFRDPSGANCQGQGQSTQRPSDIQYPNATQAILSAVYNSTGVGSGFAGDDLTVQKAYPGPDPYLIQLYIVTGYGENTLEVMYGQEYTTHADRTITLGPPEVISMQPGVPFESHLYNTMNGLTGAYDFMVTNPVNAIQQAWTEAMSAGEDQPGNSANPNPGSYP